MKRKIITTCAIILSIMQLAACNNDSISNQTIQEIDKEITTKIKTDSSNNYEYEVDNTSSKFSKSDLIYFIMVDRFKDSDVETNNFDDFDPSNPKAYNGGDLRGIIDSLDYIKGLGATAIWLTPIVKNEPFGYHGYWTEDFYKVDPHYGDLKTLKELVNKAHDKDIKVILDYIVNHTGYNHPWLTDESKKEWFHNKGTITNFKDKEQVETYDLAGLPDLDQSNPEVKSYFFENALWWIKETGIDGFRLDTVKHVSKEFWNEFAYVIKEEHPDFFLLGEVWINSTTAIEEYHDLGIDSITNFPLYEGIKDTFKLYGTANDLKIAIKNNKKLSHPEISGIFIDNHDTQRLISRTSKYHKEYLKQGLTFIMTYPSIPIIYYGTEIGLEGEADPDNRRFMKWDEANMDNEIYSHYHSMLKLRNNINDKDLNNLKLLSSASDYISYERISDKDSVVIIYNISKNDKKITLENLTFEGVYIDYLTNEEIVIDSTTEIDVLGLSSRILLMKEGLDE